jgi:hypothetical protein
MSTSPTATPPRDPKAANQARTDWELAPPIRLVSRTHREVKEHDFAQGRLVCQATLGQLEGSATVLVRTPTPEPLAAALAAEQLQVAPGDAPGTLRVSTTDPAVVGSAAFAAGIELHELRREGERP